jgi:hypothetical protein
VKVEIIVPEHESAAIELHELAGDYWVAKVESLSPTLIEEVGRRSPDFWTISRTASEISIVSAVNAHPEVTSVEGPWTAFGIVGTLDFALTGILSRCSTLLAEAAISVFAVSTYDTDYFLVRRQSAAAAMDAWRAGGLVI